MKYVSNKRPLTIKRGVADWVKEGYPDIYDIEGNKVFSISAGKAVIPHKEEQEALGWFIKSSMHLAIEKYGEIKKPRWFKTINSINKLYK